MDVVSGGTGVNLVIIEDFKNRYCCIFFKRLTGSQKKRSEESRLGCFEGFPRCIKRHYYFLIVCNAFERNNYIYIQLVRVFLSRYLLYVLLFAQLLDFFICALICITMHSSFFSFLFASISLSVLKIQRRSARRTGRRVRRSVHRCERCRLKSSRSRLW